MQPINLYIWKCQECGGHSRKRRAHSRVMRQVSMHCNKKGCNPNSIRVSKAQP